MPTATAYAWRCPPARPAARLPARPAARPAACLPAKAYLLHKVLHHIVELIRSHIFGMLCLLLLHAAASGGCIHLLLLLLLLLLGLQAWAGPGRGGRKT